MRVSLFILLIFCAVQSVAETQRPIVVRGRAEVTITRSDITLADLADVASSTTGFDEALIALKKISIERAPAPGQSRLIEANKIVERLRLSGANLNQISYIFPQQISVTRAARALTLDEIRSAIESLLRKESRNLELSNISYRDNFYVVPGELELKASAIDANTGSRRRFALQAVVDQNYSQRFEMNAEVNEWRDMPVASRSISRGNLVGGDDIQMARLNIATLPADSVHTSSEILGYAVKQDQRAGEVFRRERIAIPPLVKAGSQVTAVFRSGLLEASAKAIALEDGIEGQQIKMRNDASRRTIMGIVRQAGLVEVRQ